MGYAYNGILLCNKRAQMTDIYNSRDEHQNHQAKWKMPGTKDYTLFNSTDIKLIENANL